jgi:class 3 adenylate cyclase/tetratricopeptide (TPR) repeat protein
MSMKVDAWLRELGLQRYESLFARNAIDSDVLPELTEGDLEKLGIPLGDRKRILKAIRSLPAVSGTVGATADAVRVQAPPSGAERRHLSVLICDLVGSTALSSRLDPEDMGAVMNAYHAACSRIVQAYDGFLVDFRGDGILAYFGYPRAHGDDAERTVRAGLDLVTAVGELDTPAGEPLSVRVGIATGLVVVGDLSGTGRLREHAVIGEPPNIAARLQNLAEPGSVVIAASTRKLLGDVFRLRDLGEHDVKGIADPVGAWLVEGISPSESRLEAVRVSGLLDFVGREREMDELLEWKRLAWQGQGQVVLISGEPGIGKSRLAAALIERATGERSSSLRYQCSPYHTNSALYPVIAQLTRAAEFKADDTSEQRLDKLETVLRVSASQADSVVPLLAALMSIPCGDRYQPLALSPVQQRRRTLAALLDGLEQLARNRPVLLLFEDIHWADATSLELVDLAIERIRQLPVLALFTFHPDFEPPWVGLPHVRTLALGRLSRPEVEDMVARVTESRALPAQLMELIVGKTDGNPLFVEELTKAVLEAGILVAEAEGYRVDGPLPPLAIPATLQDSLMARLDRLGPVKEIAQIGAAIGREFSYSLLRTLVGRDEEALWGALDQLAQAELVFRRGEGPETIYSFKHALVRDAAYQSLLKSRRHQLHAQIARSLESRFPQIATTQPEIVAHHFTEAGLNELAIGYWLKAGKLALSRSANAEAVRHLRKGTELIQLLPPSADRDRKELDLHMALGPALAATQGYAAPETFAVFSNARSLLGEEATPSEQMTVFWGVYLAHAMRAEHTAAREVAERFLDLTESGEHPGMAALANRFLGQTLWIMGDFVAARSYLERALEIYAANKEKVTSFRRYGADDQVAASVALSRTLWMLGYPEQASAAAGLAVADARGMDHAFTLALALDGVAFLTLLGADLPSISAHIKEALDHSIEHRLADYEHRARFMHGVLLARSTDPQRGIKLMRSAVAALDRNRTRRTMYLAHIASAHAKLAEPEIGFETLRDAIQTAETADERFFEAELHRLLGTIHLISGKSAEAEAELQQALSIARSQKARLWELRAATTLARHWQERGKCEEAYSLLQPVYAAFAEGFETTDLKDARALLDELSGVSAQQSISLQAEMHRSPSGRALNVN